MITRNTLFDSVIKKFIVPLICSYLLFQVCHAGKRVRKEESLEVDSTNLERQSKNLFPFVWVTFQPNPCGAAAATNEIADGVCVQRGKCAKRGGMLDSGTCRDGFGECCKFEEMCNGTRNVIDVKQLVTVLKSPTNPTDTECVFRFRKEENICQIRLDFVRFTSASANDEGICETDRLTISNSITVPRGFTTCGNLDGQHMYLTFGSRDEIDVEPIIRSTMRNYEIIATRIPCDSQSRAPDYCLQYFTKSTGMVKSFDFMGQQQSNQMYTVCVKPVSQSTEGIQWKPCTGFTPAFNIQNTSTNQFPLEGDRCTKDWVQVKGEKRQCEVFPPVKSSWKPFELLVNFDESELPPLPPGLMPVPVPPGATCADYCALYDAMLPEYMCGCDATTNQCQCVQNMAMPAPVDPNAPEPISGDTKNVGFCLEYLQL